LTRYFFDLTNGERHEPDEIGIEFDQVSEARRAAINGMADIVREEMRAGSRRRLSMRVRTIGAPSVLHCVVTIDVTPQ